MKKFTEFLKDESGASAAEYAIILAVVGAGIILAAQGLTTAISGAMDRAADTIDGAGPAAAPPP